jgi:hypothetical protein
VLVCLDEKCIGPADRASKQSHARTATSPTCSSGTTCPDPIYVRRQAIKIEDFREPARDLIRAAAHHTVVRFAQGRHHHGKTLPTFGVNQLHRSTSIHLCEYVIITGIPMPVTCVFPQVRQHVVCVANHLHRHHRSEKLRQAVRLHQDLPQVLHRQDTSSSTSPRSTSTWSP